MTTPTQLTFDFMEQADGECPISVSHDMHYMHSHYGVHEAMKNLNKDQLLEFLSFRFRFLQEEVDEGFKAIDEKDAEGYVDSIIDLAVVAVGTLDLLGVDFDRAWNSVLKANLAKEVGIKASRPNKLGLPDLIKKPGWTPPDHSGNHGIISDIFKD